MQNGPLRIDESIKLNMLSSISQRTGNVAANELKNHCCAFTTNLGLELLDSLVLLSKQQL